MMTGLAPPAHGVRGNGAFALGPGTPTLAEALRARGLASAAFVGRLPAGAALRPGARLRPLRRRDGEVAGRRATSSPSGAGTRSSSRARAWLSLHPGRVFVWVHLFDPHAPYDPPSAFRGPDPYRGEVAATDAALATLLAAWNARPEPSLVVLTADHGEAFGEHGEESHSLFVYDTTLRVPLVVRGPGWPPGRRVAAAVGIADIAATIVEAVGPGGPTLPGRSLRRLARRTRRRSRSTRRRWPRGWTSDGATCAPGATGATSTSARRGPSSTTCRRIPARRATSRPRTRTSPRACAATSSAPSAALGEVESRRAPDAETAERLRALGYVQGPQAARLGGGPQGHGRRRAA